MRRLRRFIAPVLALVLLGGVASFATAAVGGSRYEYNATNNVDAVAYGVYWVAQSFTPSAAHNITSVKLYIKRQGTPGTATVSIRSAIGGANLCSGTTNGSALSESYAWVEFTLAGGTDLAAATTYYIILRATSGDSSNQIKWAYANTNVYANGNLKLSDDSGATWIYDYPTYDAAFEEWGIGKVVPAITSDNATLIKRTSARLNSTIASQGDAFDSCTVAFGYGTTTHTAANFTGYDTVTNSTGNWTTGQHPYLDVAALTANTTYYYRARATNSYSSNVSGYEQVFTTATAIGTVANVTANPSNTSMYLRWTMASGSSNTSVQYRTDGYAANHTDPSNSMGYNGTARECTITDLVAGQTYYFSLWGFDDDGYGATPATILMTTLAAAIPSGAAYSPQVTLPTPTLPAGMSSGPNITSLNLEPFTSMIAVFNSGTGGLGMPVDNAWEAIYTVIIVVAAAIIYIKTRNFFVSYLVLFLLTAGGWGMHLLQGYLLLAEIIVGMGVWAIDKYAQ